MRKPAESLDIGIEFNTKNFKIYNKNPQFFIRYKWNNQDERIFYLDDKLDLIEKEISVETFPDLKEFIEYVEQQSEKFKLIRSDYSVLALNAMRGPQSFAFGHYMVDILPQLQYLQLINIENKLQQDAKLLIYRKTAWQRNLHKLFEINQNSVVSMDEIKEIAKYERQNSTIEIYLYKLNIRFIETSLKLCRSNFVMIGEKIKNCCEQNIDILTLERGKIGHRPIRWRNSKEFNELLLKQSNYLVKEVNPSEYLPEDLAKLARRSKMIISPPGSGAYIPLHCIHSGAYVIMPIAYNCDRKETWDYTLSMFGHYSEKLILVSSKANEIVADAKKWDKEFTINTGSMLNLIKLLTRLQKKLMVDKSKVKIIIKHNRTILTMDNMVASLPKTFETLY